MSEVAFGRTVRLLTQRSTTWGDFRIGLEAVEKATGRLSFDPNVQYEGDGISFRRGDVLFGKLRPNLRKAWLADTDGDAVGDFHVYRPMPSVMTSRYLAYVVLSEPFLEPVIASVYGAKMPRADWGEIRNIKVWVPDAPEQRAIVDYLDRETAQIDAFIEKNEELIALLTERRAAVVDGVMAERGFPRPATLNISHNPSIPESWRISSLGSLLVQLTNGFVGPTRDILVEDGIRYIQGTHIKRGKIDLDRRPFFVTQEWHSQRPRIHLREGDVLIVQTGDIGKVAVVPRDFGEASCHALLIARVNDRIIDPEFLGTYLSSQFGYRQLTSRATGALHLHLESSIRSVPVVVPPLEVQARIVREVHERDAQVEEAISTSERLIQLSRERRAALISAAVTGKIDLGVAA